MKYEILKYRPELKEEIFELQTHLWGPNLALNRAYFEWKYHRNPYIDHPLIYVAFYNGQLVGMRGLMGAAWQRDGTSHAKVCPCASDVVITPQHRNRGLFEKLTRAALDEANDRGYPYAFNLSGGQATVMSSLASGWRSVGKLQTMHWVSRTKPILKSKLSHLRKFLGLGHRGKTDCFYFLDRESERSSAGSSGRVSVQPSARPEEMFELVERFNGYKGLRHKLDSQFFSWRFLNPFGGYRFLFSDDKQLNGYLVLQSSMNRVRPWIGIVDWAAANTHVLADLLRAAIQWGRFAELRIWSSTLSEEERAILFQVGFCNLDEPTSIKESLPTVLVASTRAEPVSRDWYFDDLPLLDLTHWNLRMIFSDNF